jgi:hypothetical protein
LGITKARSSLELLQFIGNQSALWLGRYHGSGLLDQGGHQFVLPVVIKVSHSKITEIA